MSSHRTKPWAAPITGLCFAASVVVACSSAGDTESTVRVGSALTKHTEGIGPKHILPRFHVFRAPRWGGWHGYGHGTCGGGTGGATQGTGGTSAVGGGAAGGAPVAVCTGTAPASSLITDFSDAVPPSASSSVISWGTPPNLTGGVYTFAASGLAVPAVSLASGSSGQALAVASAPGVPTDPGNAWLGVGLGIGSCVDATAYTGVSFTITGDLSTCVLAFSVNFSEDSSVSDNPTFGSCTASSCYGPSSATLATGVTQATITVPFSSINIGGSPLTSVNAAAITSVQWGLTAPLDGSCNANFTIDDVKFVGQTPNPVTPLSVNNQYVTDGSFAGYGYTFTYNPNGLADTITPTCVDGVGCTPLLSAPLCVSGTIPADATYSTGAGFGFNLNQAATTADGSSPVAQPAIFTGSGVVVDFANRSGSQLEAELSDGTNYWCYTLTGLASPAFIPWQSFNTACWDNSGSSFDPTASAATSFDLILPCNATTDVAFDVCLNGIGTF